MRLKRILELIYLKRLKFYSHKETNKRLKFIDILSLRLSISTWGINISIYITNMKTYYSINNIESSIFYITNIKLGTCISSIGDLMIVLFTTIFSYLIFLINYII